MQTIEQNKMGYKPVLPLLMSMAFSSDAVHADTVAVQHCRQYVLWHRLEKMHLRLFALAFSRLQTLIVSLLPWESDVGVKLPI